MAARIRDINPACELTVIREFLIPETVADLVPADVDFVIDCIDSLNCKVALVATSFERGFKVASSMGAGNKLDPTRSKIADISKTSMCPLASVMRKRLRKRGIPKGVLTVFPTRRDVRRYRRSPSKVAAATVRSTAPSATCRRCSD